METETDMTGQGEEKRGFALSLLYKMELLWLQLDYAKLQRPYRGAADEWWVLRDSEVVGPYSFASVLALLRDGAAPMHVVHETAASAEPVPWVALTYSPIWMNRAKSLPWVVSFWACVAFIGFIIVQEIGPARVHFTTGVIYWLGVLAAVVRNLFRQRYPRSATAADLGGAPGGFQPLKE